MLQLIVYFILISTICLIWGLPIYLLPGYKVKLLNVKPSTVLLSFFSGLGLISIFSAILNLLFPARIEYLVAITIPLLIFEMVALTKIKISVHPSFQIYFSKLEIAFILSCFGLFIVLATSKPSMEDSDLYHIQNIKWAHDYSAVPGVANLYLRYGFYSSWFTLISIFKLPFTHQNFNYLNFTYCIWAFLFFFSQYKKGIGKTVLEKHLSVFSLLLIFFMLAEWDLFRVASSSTSYDFVVSCSVLISITLLIRIIILKETNLEIVLPFILLPTFFYKITGFLAAPLVILFLRFALWKRRAFITCSILGSTGLLAFVLKNFIQSGYPFFPYQAASFIDVDWKVPSELVTLFNNYIFLSNHYITSHSLDVHESTIWYLEKWFTRIPKLDVLIFISSLIAFPIGWRSLKKAYNEAFGKILFMYAICLLVLTVWLLTSPDARFAYGFICFLLLFPMASLFADFRYAYLHQLFLVSFVIGISIYAYKKAISNHLSVANFICAEEADIPPYKSITSEGVSYFIPEKINENWNSRCIDCPLPCIYDINPYLRKRGTNIQSGFKMSPYPDSAFIVNYRY